MILGGLWKVRASYCATTAATRRPDAGAPEDVHAAGQRGVHVRDCRQR